MKNENLYKKTIEIGIHNDLRKKQDIKTLLTEEKDKFKKLGSFKKNQFYSSFIQFCDFKWFLLSNLVNLN